MPQLPRILLPIKPSAIKIDLVDGFYCVRLALGNTQEFSNGLVLGDTFTEKPAAQRFARDLWRYLASRCESRQMPMSPRQFILNNYETLNLRVIAENAGWDYDRLRWFVRYSKLKEPKKKRDRDALVAALVPFGYVDYDNPFELREED